MKKIERITKKVKEALKAKKIKLANEYYDVDLFISDCQSYIKAIKEGRVLVAIMSVSKLGMTRKFVVTACGRNRDRYNYRQYNMMFKTLGETVRDGEIVVSGCGMNMVFELNYTTIRAMYRLGFLTKKECSHLEQQTPQYI